MNNISLNTLSSVKIKTLEDVKKFFYWLLEDQRLNFHPDEDFDSYIVIGTEGDVPCYSRYQEEILDNIMNECHDVCRRDCKGEEDIYTIANDVLVKWQIEPENK